MVNVGILFAYGMNNTVMKKHCRKLKVSIDPVKMSARLLPVKIDGACETSNDIDQTKSKTSVKNK